MLCEVCNRFEVVLNDEIILDWWETSMRRNVEKTSHKLHVTPVILSYSHHTVISNCTSSVEREYEFVIN